MNVQYKPQRNHGVAPTAGHYWWTQTCFLSSDSLSLQVQLSKFLAKNGKRKSRHNAVERAHTQTSGPVAVV